MNLYDKAFEEYEKLNKEYNNNTAMILQTLFKNEKNCKAADKLLLYVENIVILDVIEDYMKLNGYIFDDNKEEFIKIRE